MCEQIDKVGIKKESTHDKNKISTMPIPHGKDFLLVVGIFCNGPCPQQ